MSGGASSWVDGAPRRPVASSFQRSKHAMCARRATSATWTSYSISVTTMGRPHTEHGLPLPPPAQPGFPGSGSHPSMSRPSTWRRSASTSRAGCGPDAPCTKRGCNRAARSLRPMAAASRARRTALRASRACVRAMISTGDRCVRMNVSRSERLPNAAKPCKCRGCFILTPIRFAPFFFFQAAPGLTHAEVVHRELEQMEWTEELGFDQIWLTEHHFIDYCLAGEPAARAAAAAARTRRVRIGLAAAILPFHHPLRLAEQLALIDIISKGRLDVGFCRGNRPAEFRGYHVPQQENRERFDEAVDIMLRAWTEGRFSPEGPFFQIGGAPPIPKPWQRPHPPIYQVCGSDDGIESSAARGWPMLNSILTGPVDQLVKRRDSYLTALRKHGRSEAEIAALMANWGVSRQIYVADTDAQALAEARDAEMWYQDSLRRFQVPERIEDAHPSLQPGFRAAAERFKKVTWEKLVAETVAFGSPDTVAKHIEN